MRLPLLLAALLFAAAPAAAQAPEWRAAADYDILLEPFDIEPAPLRLEAGRPVALRFVNSGQRSLSFSAPAFFRAATIRPGDESAIQAGAIHLEAGERRTIYLVPQRGRYRMRSDNLLHRLLGMSGRIIVE